MCVSLVSEAEVSVFFTAVSIFTCSGGQDLKCATNQDLINFIANSVAQSVCLNRTK